MSFLESPFNPMATLSTQTTMRSISSIDPKLSRTNYYDGRLLKASDLVRDQLYLDERLREVGRALGQGIVRGLDVELTPQKKLIVHPGLAVTPSGRVLELETTTLEINLLDSAKLNELNPGFSSLGAGLYAVVVQYAEQGSGSAEVYPKDLESERGFHFNAYAEGVEFTLVKLSTHLPFEKMRNLSTEEIAVYSRSSLVRSLLVANPGQVAGMGEDGIALGLLAVEYGEPQWLDRGLLRRPFRNSQSLNYLQQDLYNHYEELLAAVLDMRRTSGNQQPFLVKQYFSVLPPVGSIPKASLDPINGYQNFFPEGFEVSISPVRADDVASILQQSMALEPIDLQVDKDVDIMIAVVLDDLNFSYLARQLQQRDPADADSFIQPAHFDEILLSNFAIQTDTNSTTATLWKKLWDATSQIFYVRRPVRVAETQVSAVVLAKGNYADLKAINSLPQPAELLEKDIDDLTQQLNDSQSTILQLTDELKTPADKKIQEAQAAQATAEAEVKQQKESVQKITDQLTQAQADQKAAEDKAAEAQASAKKINTELTATKKQLESALEQIKVLSDNSNAPNNDQEVNDLKAKLEEAQAALDKAKAEVDASNATIQTSATQITNLQAQLDSAQNDIKKLQEQIAAGTTPAPKVSVEDVASIKTMKLTQIIPKTLEIDATDRETITAAATKDTSLLKPLSQLKTLVSTDYDSVLWASVAVCIEAGTLQDFVDYTVLILLKPFPLGLGIAANTKLKLSTSLRNAWSAIDLK